MPRPDLLEIVNVAVAFVENSDNKLFVVWNQRWRCFGFPMVKMRGVRTIESWAMAAAGEELGIPVIKVQGRSPLVEKLPQSAYSDDKNKHKNYHCVSLRVDPTFEELVKDSWRHHLWMSPADVFAGSSGPMDPSLIKMLQMFLDANWVSPFPVSTGT